MSYKLAIFDLDGTILNTLDDLAGSLNFALKKNGFAERSKSEVRAFVGNGIRLLVKRGMPDGAKKADEDSVFDDFCAHYKAHCADFTMPYSDITELLSQLKNRGVQTAVVSNKADFAVQELVKRYFDGCFSVAVGEKEGVRKKPAPDSVNAVLSSLGTEVKDAVYIGDSEVDIETAKNAGIECISVSWGFRDKAQLVDSGAKTIVSEPSELLSII